MKQRNNFSIVSLLLRLSVLFTVFFSSGAHAYALNHALNHASDPIIDQAVADKIIRATRFDDIQKITQFAQQGGDLNLAEPERGETLLMICIRENASKVFDFLLLHPKINLNQRAKNGDTALMLAAYLEQKELVQRLIGAGAQVNQSGWSALHYASVVGNYPIMAYLLEQHAEVNAETPNKTTSLMLAARRGEMVTVKLLLDAGADVSSKNMLGWTAYDFAIEAERRDISAFLQERMQAKVMRRK
jgi:ankyrin repeat protein